MKVCASITVEVLPGWWPFAVHSLSIFLMPVAWVWVMVHEHPLLTIFVVPALVVVSWLLTFAGTVSGWRFDRRKDPGPGRVAGWTSLALLMMVLLASTYLLVGAAPFNGGWVLLGLVAVGHGLCARQLLWRPPAVRAPDQAPVPHLPLAIVLATEGTVLLMALSRVHVLGTYGPVAVAVNATLGVMSLALAALVLVMRSNEEPVPQGLQAVVAGYAVAFLLVLVADLYLVGAMSGYRPHVAPILILVVINAAKLAVVGKTFGRRAVPA